MSILVNPGSEPITPGNTVELECDFLDDAMSGKEEPTSVEIELVGPEGAPPINLVPAKVSTGIWHCSFLSLPLHKGRWWFYWKGDGVAATKGTFVIGGTTTP